MLDVLANKVRRAKEARYIIGDCAADLGSRAALLSCYAGILRDFADPTEVSFRVAVSGRVFPFRMRKSDIFTLGEILHEQQYRLTIDVPPAPTIIDAGANVGVTALWFLAQHPGATLHAFEPEPGNFALLQANFGADPKVTLSQAALGAEPGTLQLHLGEHGAAHTLYSGAGGRTVDVSVLSLGDYLEQHGIERVDLLKLDVEGAELEVLQGLGDRIGRIHAIVGEVHERMMDQHAFYTYLRDHGFEIVRRIDFIDGDKHGVHGFEAVQRPRAEA